VKHNAAVIPDRIVEQAIAHINEMAFEFLMKNNLIPQGVTKDQMKHRVKSYARKKGIPLLIPSDRGSNVRDARHAARETPERFQQDDSTAESDSLVPASTKRTRISPTTSIVSVSEEIGDVASSPVPTPSPVKSSSSLDHQPRVLESENSDDYQIDLTEQTPKPVELWMLNTDQLIQFLLAKNVNLPTTVQEQMRKEDIDGEVFVQLSEMVSKNGT